MEIKKETKSPMNSIDRGPIQEEGGIVTLFAGLRYPKISLHSRFLTDVSQTESFFFFFGGWFTFEAAVRSKTKW